MPGGAWCAVGLNKSVENGNHKWREFCSGKCMTCVDSCNRSPKAKAFRPCNSVANMSEIDL